MIIMKGLISRVVIVNWIFAYALILTANGQTFSVVTCQNSAFAPPRLQSGQFTTGPCQKSSECIENCCDLNGKCRAPLALKPQEEFCEASNFSPNFNGPVCQNEDEAIPKRLDDVGNVNDGNGGAEDEGGSAAGPVIGVLAAVGVVGGGFVYYRNQQGSSSDVEDSSNSNNNNNKKQAQMAIATPPSFFQPQQPNYNNNYYGGRPFNV